MTITVRFTFPWGRYHATPWDRNVNEGAVDWPPSPWRLLRTLVAVAHWHEPVTPTADLVDLLRQLEGVPRYNLPDYTIAHTRHYLPGVRHARGAVIDTEKTLDTFVVMERGAHLDVTWAADLTSAERRLLNDLVGRIGYLGRAESICEATLVDEPAEQPAGSAHHRVLVPTAPLDYPALTSSATALRSRRTLTPPSTSWESISLPAPRPRTAQARRRPAEPVTTAVLLAVDGKPRPRLVDALAVCDALHKAAVHTHAESAILRGKRGDEVMATQHTHAHYLPVPSTDPRSSNTIQTLLVWAPAGLASQDIRALGSIRRLWARDGWRLADEGYEDSDALRLAFVASGCVADLVAPLVRRSSVWRSFTPYLTATHPRRLPRAEHLTKDVRREVGFRSQFASGGAVRVTEVEPSAVAAPWAFRRHRLGRSRDTAGRGAMLQLEFEREVTGPVSLGALSHFGMGLFVPAD